MRYPRTVSQYLAQAAGIRGHIFDDVSARPSGIPLCKTGDSVVTMGPDHPAKGVGIVFEGKDEEGYSVPMMLKESERARKNRGATFGVFAISIRCAPAGMLPLMRYGDDIIVTWDADNPVTNISLDAALDMACGLLTHEAATKGQPIDFDRVARELIHAALDDLRITGRETLEIVEAGPSVCRRRE